MQTENNISKENNEEVYYAKKMEVLNLIEDFFIVSKKTIVKYLNGDTKLCGRILNNLIRSNKISTNDNEIFVIHKGLLSKVEDLEIYKKLLLIYVTLKEQNPIGEYVFPDDKYIKMTFEAGGELFDVIYVKYGQENSINQVLRMKERYLPPEDKESLNRIVLIDDEEQISKLNINGTRQFVTIDFEENIKFIPCN